jgi:hypothetical protein
MPRVSTPASKDAPAPRRSRRRRLLIGGGLFACLLLVGYFTLTSQWVLGRIVLSQLGAAFGGTASASKVTFAPGGFVVLEHPSLRAPGVAGHAGEVFAAARIKAKVHLHALLGGGRVVESITLDRPVIRISQSIVDRSVNIAALDTFGADSRQAPGPATRPQGTRGPSPQDLIPQITLNSGVIQIGEHDARSFRSLKQFDLEGRVISATDAQGGLQVSLREVPTPGQSPSHKPLEVTGRVAADTLTLRASGLELGDLSAESVPQPLRERFRSLELVGTIGVTTLTYHLRTGGLEARTALENVALNLPITPKPGIDINDRVIPVPQELRDRLLRMEDVRGELVLSDRTISGSMRGTIEELPYDVSFSVDGTGDAAPFSARLVCSDFELKEQPTVVLFAPGIVRRRLEQFSNPTGIINTTVDITRGPPAAGKAADVKVKGTLSLKKGSAAFERFPYRFHNLEVDATFDENSLHLTRIIGDTPDGAKVSATTFVSPLTDDAGVTVDVKVTGLPVDADLAAAMKQRGKIIDTLFNDAKYRDLVDAGLVIEPDRHARLSARRDELLAKPRRTAADTVELADIAGIFKRPVFQPGGTATVTVKVTRLEGPESIWNDTVDIAFDEVRILPEAFPYPMVGRNVLMRKVDYDTTVEGGTYEGLSGATARIAAKCDLQKLDAPDAPFVPMVEVKAENVATDAYLLFALPNAAGLSPDGRPLRELIGDLHLEGRGKAHAKVFQLEGDDAKAYGDAGYDILVDVTGMQSTPRKTGAPAAFSLANIGGTLDIRHDALELKLKGNAGPVGTDAVAMGDIRLDASIHQQPVRDPQQPVRDPQQPATGPASRGSSRLSLDARATAIEASTPVEDLVWLFSPQAAIDIAAARTELQPAGRTDLLTTLRREPGDSMQVRVAAWNPKGLELSARGTRVGITCEQSSEQSPFVTIEPGDASQPTQVRFHGRPLSLTDGERVVARAVIDGVIRADGAPVPGDREGLRLAVTEADFASVPVATLVKASLPPAVAAFLTERRVTGIFDADVSLTHDKGPGFEAAGSVRPRSLALVEAGTPVSFSKVSGAIDFRRNSGEWKDLELVAPTWTAGTRGSWQVDPAGETIAHMLFSVAAPSLVPDLRACLPEDVRTMLKDLLMQVDGPVATDGLRLSLTFPTSGGIGGFNAAGRINAANVSLDAGLKLANAKAVLDFTASRPDAASAASFDAFILSESLQVADVAVTNAKVRASSAGASMPGGISIQQFSGDCHGGRVSGEATMSATRPDGRREFTARAQGSNIRFASVLADFRASRASAGVQVPAFEADTTPDGSRGMVDFGVTLTGLTGTPESRRGRGTASVGGGRVASMPLVVPLIRISNLQLPVNERLDYAQADFFLQGTTIEFEQAWISSPGVELVGYGSMQWPDATVDVRIRGNSRTRIPLVSKVMEDIRNELFTARLTGPLWDPSIGIESFSGTSRFIRKLVGSTPSEAVQRLQRIERNATRSQDRPREPQRGDPAPSSPR